jgi:hypothetical protein
LGPSAYFLADPLVEFDFVGSHLLVTRLNLQDVLFHRRAISALCDECDAYRYRVDGRPAPARSMNS